MFGVLLLNNGPRNHPLVERRFEGPVPANDRHGARSGSHLREHAHG